MNAFGVNPQSPASVILNLANNGYNSIRTRDFGQSTATSIDLSRNGITAIADDAFIYNFALRSLVSVPMPSTYSEFPDSVF